MFLIQERKSRTWFVFKNHFTRINISWLINGFQRDLSRVQLKRDGIVLITLLPLFNRPMYFSVLTLIGLKVPQVKSSYILQSIEIGRFERTGPRSLIIIVVSWWKRTELRNFRSHETRGIDPFVNNSCLHTRVGNVQVRINVCFSNKRFVSRGYLPSEDQNIIKYPTPTPKPAEFLRLIFESITIF